MRNTRRGVYLISLFTLIVIYPPCLFSQETSFNLSVRNGLPTNQTYRTIVDKNGYLWIATAKGVVKYNGYTTKIFNSADGIANEDIWNLFEDNKGRIWLASISDEIGYIYNDEYHKAVVDVPIKIYPTNFINYDKGIMFLTSDKITTEIVCIERNDTIVNCIDIHSKKFKYTLQHYLHPKMGVRYFDGCVYCVHFINNKISFQKLRTRIQAPKTRQLILNGKYLIPEIKLHTDDTILHVVDIEKDTDRVIHLDENEETIEAINDKSYTYLTTTKRIYKYDANLNLLDYIMVDSIGIKRKINPISFIDDLNWQRVISTTNSGVIVESPRDLIQKSNVSFAMDKYVGNYRDSLYYFWNTSNRTLSTYTSKKQLIQKEPLNISFINKAIALSNSKLILLNSENTFVLDKHLLTYFLPQNATPYWIQKDSSIITIQHLNFKIPVGITSYAKSQDLIIDTLNYIHLVSMANNYVTQYASKDSIIMHVIDSSRYEHIVKYPLANCYIVQGKNQLLIDKGNSSFKITADELSLSGIKSIEQVLVDTVGNIFIKSTNKLFAYNPLLNKFISLYNGYNLNGASIHLYKNQLVAVGRFGVIYSTILPRLMFSTPTSLINFKAQKYSYVNESYIVGDNLYMDTDMGLYTVDLSKKNAIRQNINFTIPCNLYASSTLFNGIISSRDTIILDQSSPSLDLDFINPYGDGNVKYTYTIDGKSAPNWIAASRIDLPTLEPGKYHEMRLVVNDDSWVSREYSISIFLNAYWWQTSVGKRWLLLLSVLILGGLTFVVVLTTRHILNRKHSKENKYLELELKSIYAQLNPHFIFNTLSNIVYYIKKDRKQEAYKYLNTFSKLLRSYIKSSRNKWLPLSEEIENIENYIILQQSRFENKFDYSLNIDEGLDTENILLPSLLLQPLVENAIHHGLQPKEEKGTLKLSFKKTNNEDTIIIVIEDDGIGRIKAKQFAKNSLNKRESFGSNLIEDLTTIYKRYELFSIDIDYYDKTEPLTGTIVTLTIKYHS